MRLTGKVALVTGAQQGIGRAIALALAREGADVGVNYLDDRGAADKVVQEVRGADRRTVLVQADVAQPASAQAMVEQVVGELGGIDVLVNNAGVYPRVPLLEMRESDWDLVLDVNLKGGFFCAQAAARAMIAAGRRGSIINMASQAIRGAVRGVHYSASKGGVVAMTRAMALELAPHGIRVNAIAPGLTDTARPRGSGQRRGRARAAAGPDAPGWQGRGRGVGGRSPPTSPGSPCFSRATRRDISPAKPCTSTAARSCHDDDDPSD